MQASDADASLAGEALRASKGWYLELRFDYFHISEAQGTNICLEAKEVSKLKALSTRKSIGLHLDEY